MNTNCNFCKKTKIKRLPMNLKDFIKINFLKCKNFYTTFSIYYCENCYIAYTVPKPKNFNYEYYEFYDDSINDINILPRQWKKSINTQIDLIENTIDRRKKILEIGCGKGLLLKELMNRGYNVAGVETSKKASSFAMSNGINIYNSSFENSSLNEKFDMIILSHVFEHIERTDQFLSKCLNILNNNGYIFFTQTNWRGLIPIVEKSKWYAWVPEQHYWHFSPVGLINYLKKYKLFKHKLYFSTLEHQNSFLSLLTEMMKTLADQFYLIVKKND